MIVGIQLLYCTLVCVLFMWLIIGHMTGPVAERTVSRRNMSIYNREKKKNSGTCPTCPTAPNGCKPCAGNNFSIAVTLYKNGVVVTLTHTYVLPARHKAVFVYGTELQTQVDHSTLSV